jgi:hypothetical protein
LVTTEKARQLVEGDTQSAGQRDSRRHRRLTSKQLELLELELNGQGMLPRFCVSAGSEGEDVEALGHVGLRG